MIDKKTAFAKAVDLAIDTTKLIITLSTTIITLSVTVLKLFITNICFCNMLYLSMSWLCFLASIVLGFFYILGITGRYALIGQGKTALAFKRLGINETASRQKFGWMLGSFVFGIVFLLIFGVSITTINLEEMKVPKFNKEQKEQKMQASKPNNKTFIFLSHWQLSSSPYGPIPHNMARPLIGPPTLERSGSEHRVGRLHP